MGIDTALISGGNEGACRRLAELLLIPHFKANVLPRDKVRLAYHLKVGGMIVALVGDGINDAPAIAAADVGIAMESRTDIAMHTAAITSLRPDPRLVATAIAISRATVRKIAQNLFWAFA